MRNSKRVKIVAGGTAVLFGVGVAFAAWTSTGEGSGQVTSTSDQGLTVTSTNASGLFPTGQQTITVTVENKNPYKVALDSITVDDITSNDAACNVEEVTAPHNNAPGVTLEPAGVAGDSADFPFVVSMSNDADDDCQGDTFTVDFTATGHSSN
jgi:hypothetical protein